MKQFKSFLQLAIILIFIGFSKSSLMQTKAIEPSCSLTKNEIENIAITHNQILPSANKNMKGRNLEELHASYKNYLKLNYPREYKYFNLNVTITQQLFTFNVNQFTFMRGLSKKFKSVTQNAINIVLNANSLEELNTNLNKLERSLGSLDKCELMALQAFIAVAKKSAIYWWSENRDKSGWNLGEFIAADALGAYGGFLRSAVLAPVPGANTAIAGAAAFGAVWGSASYSILTLNDDE